MAAVSGAGILAAKILLQKPPFITLLPITLYTAMEFLQYMQYDTLDDCKSTRNSTLAKVAYYLIWLQPIVWNLTWSASNSSPVFKYTLALSVFVFFLCLDRHWLRILHNGPVNKNEAHNTGQDCTRKGKTHLFWTFDLKTAGGLEPNWILYFLLMFAPHIYLGDTQHFAKSMVAGLVLAWSLAGGRVEEFTSYWCANSVPYLVFAEVVSLLKPLA